MEPFFRPLAALDEEQESGRSESPGWRYHGTGCRFSLTLLRRYTVHFFPVTEVAADKQLGVVFMTTLKLKTLFLILPALFFLSPICAAEFTYKEYTKASESWRRGFVFGISRYMSTVAQPDEEVPYPVRTAFQRCLGGSTDTLLARHVEAYAATNPGSSNGSMVAVVMRALFDLCRSEIEKTKPDNTAPGQRSRPR